MFFLEESLTIQKSAYKCVIDWYWWENLYEKIRKYVKTCEQCQRRDSEREKKALHSIWITLLWKKIDLNIVYMSSNADKSFLIVARDDLSSWIEIRTLLDVKFWRMTKFLWENVICRHECFEKLVVDDESENKEVIEKLMKKYKIKKVIIFVYHSQVNEMMKRDHRSLIDVLTKMSDEKKNWVEHLSAVLWANRITVKFTTEMTSYYLICDSELVLLIELDISTWRILSWDIVHIVEELLKLRARQLKRRNEDLNETRDLLKRMRKKKKKYFDELHSIKNKEINFDDLVLLRDV
jgi:hypothetical protein